MTQRPSPPPDPSRPAPFNFRRLLKALAAIFGGSLLVVALGIIAFCRSEVGQAAWGPAKEMRELYSDTMNTPGTTELKKLGCGRAAVMDTSRWGNVGAATFDADPCAVERREDGLFTPQVTRLAPDVSTILLSVPTFASSRWYARPSSITSASGRPPVSARNSGEVK
jgi:hypothetical protein